MPALPPNKDKTEWDVHSVNKRVGIINSHKLVNNDCVRAVFRHRPKLERGVNLPVYKKTAKDVLCVVLVGILM